MGLTRPHSAGTVAHAYKPVFICEHESRQTLLYNLIQYELCGERRECKTWLRQVQKRARKVTQPTSTSC